jgi:GTPase
VWVSARDALGLDLLRTAIGGVLELARVQGDVRLPPEAGRLRARLHALEAVRGEEHDDGPDGGGWTLRIDLPLSEAARLAAQSDGAPLRALLPAGHARTAR